MAVKSIVYCVPKSSPAPIEIVFVPVYVSIVPPFIWYVPDVALFKPKSSERLSVLKVPPVCEIVFRGITFAL